MGRRTLGYGSGGEERAALDAELADLQARARDLLIARFVDGHIDDDEFEVGRTVLSERIAVVGGRLAQAHDLTPFRRSNRHDDAREVTSPYIGVPKERWDDVMRAWTAMTWRPEVLSHPPNGRVLDRAAGNSPGGATQTAEAAAVVRRRNAGGLGRGGPRLSPSFEDSLPGAFCARPAGGRGPWRCSRRRSRRLA